MNKGIREIIDTINSTDCKTKERYFIDSHSNLVMVKFKSKSKCNNQSSIVNKILLPNSLIRNCLQFEQAPHFTTNKTYNFIKNKHYWEGIFLDTKNFYENCS